ncbi:DUF2752 domain-containing protein [Spongiactinospora sp. TRM90649]|uniref:DUF2752 domain-containing protein n=1 Tax=Spongiactinospora sp. TRM90649 TaxID=3031114 RepID=UPI0023F88D38|nr:DUF2752 domain-containing protein [Spongiactinospora sp. TRM90649]MDF5755983.1 DUF2752 domain-containing protein [Spongiactinospora sp. TRM90649]
MTDIRGPGAGRGASRRLRLPPVLAPVGAALAAAAAFGYVGLVDPNEPGHYPTCPFLALTGLYCPGCGTLRATHALAHGEPVAALGLNALAIAVIPVVLYLWARWVVITLRPGRARPVRVRPAWIWGWAVIVIAYWIVRNLPFAAFLAP